MKRGEKLVTIEYRLSDSKNKYLILGPKNPAQMKLPVVLDITQLEDLLNKILHHFERKTVRIVLDDPEDNKLRIILGG